MRPIDSAVSGIRDLARLPDGRVVVGAESGVFVGDPSGWTTVWQEPGGWIFDVEVDAAGTIWAAGGLDAQGVALRSFEAVGGAWRETRHPGCPAGGMLVAPASDGTVWTAGIGYSGTSGLARLDGESCTEVFPFGDDARHDVTAIAADGRGRVAAIVIDTWSGGSPDHVGGGRLLEWEDGRWTTLYEDEVLGVFGNVLSYAPDGTLWAAMDWKLWRFVGREATAVRDVDALGVSVAPDGAVWYVGRASVVTRLLPDEAQP